MGVLRERITYRLRQWLFAVPLVVPAAALAIAGPAVVVLVGATDAPQCHVPLPKEEVVRDHQAD